MRNRDQIITDAFRKIGALGDSETLDTYRLTAGSNAISTSVKALNVLGMQLWKLKQYSFSFNVPGMDPTGVPVGPGRPLSTSTVPLKFISAQRYDQNAKSNVPLNYLERTKFFELSRPQVAGVPTHVSWQPMKGEGILRVWPAADSYWKANGFLQIDFQETYTDLITGSDLPDFPDYWEKALIYDLATLLAPEYGVPIQDRQVLMAERDKYVNEAKDFGNEDGSIFFQPSYNWSSISNQ